MIAKLNFTCLLGALFCFFLPWLEFRCVESTDTMFVQSGFQAAYGGSTMDEKFAKALTDSDKAPEQDGEGAPIIAVAFAVTILGVLVALLRFFKKAFPKGLAPGMALLALLLIAVQMWMRFPMESKFRKSLTGSESKGEVTLEDLNIAIVYQPWIFVTMALLALVSLSFLFKRCS